MPIPTAISKPDLPEIIRIPASRTGLARVASPVNGAEESRKLFPRKRGVEIDAPEPFGPICVRSPKSSGNASRPTDWLRPHRQLRTAPCRRQTDHVPGHRPGSKFTYVDDSAGKREGSAFLKAVVAVFPYKIHTVLTDNGMAFADLPKNREGPSRRFLGPMVCLPARFAERGDLLPRPQPGVNHQTGARRHI